MLPPAATFWAFLDQLVASYQVIIDRPKNTPHPSYPEILYPLDYGYLESTSSIDGGGIDVWIGASGIHNITAAIVTVDLQKRDAEIKILLGCTDEEMQVILDFHNTKSMRALLLRRTEIKGDCP
jgi:inorganic pyrophosphatase